MPVLPTILQQFSIFQYDTFKSVALKTLHDLYVSYDRQDFQGKNEKLRVIMSLANKIKTQDAVDGSMLRDAARVDMADAALIKQLLFCKKVTFTQNDIQSIKDFSPKGAEMMEVKRSALASDVASVRPGS